MNLIDELTEGYEEAAAHVEGLPSAFADRLQLYQGRLLTRSRTCEGFLYEKLPGMFSLPPSIYHRAFYEHIDSMALGEPSLPFLACWPRGTGKSTAGMGGVAYLAAMRQTILTLIVSEHLPNAQDRLQTLRAMFEDPSFRRSFPQVAKPARNGAGKEIAWNNRTLYNKAGQIFHAVSLKSGKRGVNKASTEQHDPDTPEWLRKVLEAARVDLVVLDDIDNQLDSIRATLRKENIISTEIMAMGGRKYPLRVWILQNRIIEDGVVGRVLKRVDGCIAPSAAISGPWPAVVDLVTKPVMRTKEAQGTLDLHEDEIIACIRAMHNDDEKVSTERNVIEYPAHDIIDGKPSWIEGMDLTKCQQLIDDMGLGEFLIEMCHVTTNKAGALLSDKHFQQVPRDFDLSKVTNKIVSVDPGGGATESGIVVVGSAVGFMGDGQGGTTRCQMYYVLEDLTVSSKEGWERPAIMAASRHRCDVVVETNYGGNNLTRAAETVRDVMKQNRELSGHIPDIHPVIATNNKPDRAVPFATVYKEGRVWHVGDMSKLEREWTSTLFTGDNKVDSPNRLDAAVHGFDHLEKRVGRWGLL